MALDFSQVTSILLPEGVNKTVPVSSGSKSFNSSGTSSSFTYLNYYPTSQSDLGQQTKLRIKFSVSIPAGEYDEGEITYYDEFGVSQDINISTDNESFSEAYDITVRLNNQVNSSIWNVFEVEIHNQLGTGNSLRVQVNKTGNTNLDVYYLNAVNSNILTLTISEVDIIRNVYVSSINDANNNIIWGSQAAYPYRRLEYIHFNGTDNYISTGITNNSTKYRAITVSIDTNDVSGDIYILGSRDTSIDATKQRYWLPRLDGNGIRFVVGSTWTSNNAYPIATYLPVNTKRIIYGTTSSSSSNMKLVFGIDDTSGNTLTSGNITGGAVSGFNQRELALMATNDGSGSSGMTPKGYCPGKVYNFIERATNSSGTISHNFIPCQRKSDGAYGMYDVISGNFKALQGTADANTGGPVINEYWDLTI